MYCEITLTHKKAPSEDELKTVIQKPFAKEVALSSAFARSEIYNGLSPQPTALFAFEFGRCFVIVVSVDAAFSRYHLEGNDSKVSIGSRRLAAQQFSAALTNVLRTNTVNPDFEARKISLTMFEDNAQETGIEGGDVTLASVLKEKLAFKEIRSDLLSFVTASLLIWLGLKKEPLDATLYSGLTAAVFVLGDIVSTYWQNKDTIIWKLRQT
jgi:hypothetical protein